MNLRRNAKLFAELVGGGARIVYLRTATEVVTSTVETLFQQDQSYLRSILGMLLSTHVLGIRPEP